VAPQQLQYPSTGTLIILHHYYYDEDLDLLYDDDDDGKMPTTASNLDSSCGERFTDELCTAPEVCANDEESKEQHLLKHAAFDDNANIVQRTLKRDRAMIVAILLMVVLMRIPYLKYILYPFMIFSTWVHEFCGRRY
jgi:hypothetical protein